MAVWRVALIKQLRIMVRIPASPTYWKRQEEARGLEEGGWVEEERVFRCHLYPLLGEASSREGVPVTPLTPFVWFVCNLSFIPRLPKATGGDDLHIPTGVTRNP